jgi:hypothetical protein
MSTTNSPASPVARRCTSIMSCPSANSAVTVMLSTAAGISSSRLAPSARRATWTAASIRATTDGSAISTPATSPSGVVRCVAMVHGNGWPSTPHSAINSATPAASGPGSASAVPTAVVGTADGSPGRGAVDASAGVPDPALCRTLTGQRGRDGDQFTVGDHLDQAGLIQNDRVLEPDIGQRRRPGLCGGSRKCLQQNGNRHQLDPVHAVTARIGLGVGDQPRLPYVMERRGGQHAVLAEQGSPHGRRTRAPAGVVHADPVPGVLPGGGWQYDRSAVSGSAAGAPSAATWVWKYTVSSSTRRSAEVTVTPSADPVASRVSVML